MFDRRTFLRGHASLPLIGGGVTLIGNPTAAAVPVTTELLDAYNEWLDLERSWLMHERYGSRPSVLKGHPIEVVWRDKRTGQCWSSTRVPRGGGFDHANPSSRAAVVLSAVGVPLA